jgi:hypothetical protein
VAWFYAESVNSVFARLLHPLATFPDPLSHFHANSRLCHDSTITISHRAPQEPIDSSDMGDFAFYFWPDFRHFAFASPRSEHAGSQGVVDNG